MNLCPVRLLLSGSKDSSFCRACQLDPKDSLLSGMGLRAGTQQTQQRTQGLRAAAAWLGGLGANLVTEVLEACDWSLEPTDERRRPCGLVICSLVVAAETGGPWALWPDMPASMVSARPVRESECCLKEVARPGAVAHAFHPGGEGKQTCGVSSRPAPSCVVSLSPK